MNEKRQAVHDRLLAYILPALAVLVWFLMTELGSEQGRVVYLFSSASRRLSHRLSGANSMTFFM